MPKPTKASRRKSYFGGHGSQVLADMQKRYGKQEGERVFYATATENALHGSKAQKAAQPKTPPGGLGRQKAAAGRKGGRSKP